MEQSEVERLVEVEQRSKSNSHRLDKLEEQTQVLHDMSTTLAVMVQKQDVMTNQLTEVVSDVKLLKAEPGDMWKAVVKNIVLILVAGVVGYFLAMAGIQ